MICNKKWQPSIQGAVSSVCENGTRNLVPTQRYLTVVTGINSFIEPNFLVYEVHYPPLDKALTNFRAKLPFSAEKELLVQQCRERRIGRVQLCEEQVREAVGVHTPLGKLALINF